MSAAGYFASPWPAEDGGPRRLQQARTPGLRLQAGERLRCVTRNTFLSTMTVLGAPGEVFLLTHSALRARIGLPTTACVERIDPLTLKTRCRSPCLRGGPMWPGGMAVHRHGDLLVVYGRHAHRLNRDCKLLASARLPQNEPYNSFVVLDNGLVVTKNLSRTMPARLSVLDPTSLQSVGEDTVCPEPSVARLSSRGNTVYVVGVRSILRYTWDDSSQRLQRDSSWAFDYLGQSDHSHGWDVVIDEQNAWFMDNGEHRYFIRMTGAGVRRSANRLIRVSLNDSRDHDLIDVSGLAGGSITNPPLVDMQRHIVVGYDSANHFVRAWRHDPSDQSLTPLWQRSGLGCASHMILYPDSGELVLNDYRRLGEEVVVLDIETGTERGRVRVGGINQGVVFPSTGWGRDLYWSSMSRLSRVYVQ